MISRSLAYGTDFFTTGTTLNVGSVTSNSWLNPRTRTLPKCSIPARISTKKHFVFPEVDVSDYPSDRVFSGQRQPVVAQTTRPHQNHHQPPPAPVFSSILMRIGSLLWGSSSTYQGIEPIFHKKMKIEHRERSLADTAFPVINIGNPFN